jgi:hypothetical protein
MGERKIKSPIDGSHTVELISRLFLADPEVLPPRVDEALLSLKFAHQKEFRMTKVVSANLR